MRDTALFTNLTFDEYEAGEQQDEETLQQVLRLFDSYYYAYHYLDKICLSDRYRIVCRHERKVVGFAAASIEKRWALLSNFLVHESFRRCGIGEKMESIRMRYCRRNGYHIYSSSDTTLPGSQILKMKHGLVPVNVKYGYRRGVYGVDDLSSAVSFVSKGRYPVGRHEGKVEIDDKLKRARIVSGTYDYICSYVAQLQDIDGCYIDVLASGEAKDKMMTDDSFYFTGFECDFKSEERDLNFYYLFQFKNRVFHQALWNYNNSILSRDDIIRPINRYVHETHFCPG